MSTNNSTYGNDYVNCNGQYFVGDQYTTGGNSLTKTITGLDPHSLIRVSFHLIAADDWEPTDTVLFLIDNVQQWVGKPGTHDFYTFDCGYYTVTETSSENGGLRFKPDIITAHTSSSLSLTWSEIGADMSEWFGLRDVTVTTYNCTSGCAICGSGGSSDCQTCDAGYYRKGRLCLTDCGERHFFNTNTQLCEGT